MTTEQRAWRRFRARYQRVFYHPGEVMPRVMERATKRTWKVCRAEGNNRPYQNLRKLDVTRKANRCA